jgi:hypothetical protein
MVARKHALDGPDVAEAHQPRQLIHRQRRQVESCAQGVDAEPRRQRNHQRPLLLAEPTQVLSDASVLQHSLIDHLLLTAHALAVAVVRALFLKKKNPTAHRIVPLFFSTRATRELSAVHRM